MSTKTINQNCIEVAADIVSAFVSNNSIRIADLSSLISNVHAALQRADQPAAKSEEAKLSPPVAVKKSVTPDHLISLEDGKQYKSLKRHLGKLGLTPEAYREKWGLPPDYPMVAPNYAAKRSELARSMGLGQRRSKIVQAKAPVVDTVKTGLTKPATKRGRRKAA